MKKVQVPRKIIFSMKSQSGFETSISDLSLSNVTFATNLVSSLLTHFLLPLPMRTIEQYMHSNFFYSLQNLKRSNYVDRFLQTKIFRFPKCFCTQCSASDTHLLLIRIRIQASLGRNIFWKLRRYRNTKFFTFSNLDAIFAVLIWIRAPKKLMKVVPCLPGSETLEKCIMRYNLGFEIVLIISLYLSPSVQ